MVHYIMHSICITYVYKLSTFIIVKFTMYKCETQHLSYYILHDVHIDHVNQCVIIVNFNYICVP